MRAVSTQTSATVAECPFTRARATVRGAAAPARNQSKAPDNQLRRQARGAKPQTNSTEYWGNWGVAAQCRDRAVPAVRREIRRPISDRRASLLPLRNRFARLSCHHRVRPAPKPSAQFLQLG